MGAAPSQIIHGPEASPSRASAVMSRLFVTPTRRVAAATLA
jgi:hypothetical protein